MKILAISHLFPNLLEPRYGIFVARQLQEMSRLGADITVLVPTMWFPSVLTKFRRWKNISAHAELCTSPGLETNCVSYPRLPGNWYNRWSGLVVHQVCRRLSLKLHKCKDFDIIYATDLFPDGDAARRLAGDLQIPSACLCIGADVNITAQSSPALHEHFVKVVTDLDGTLACGKPVSDSIDRATGRKSLTVYGVVDLESFRPVADKHRIRADIGLPHGKAIFLYAGYFDERKGIVELLKAYASIAERNEDVLLVMCGDGRLMSWVRQFSVEKGIEDRLILPGQVEADKMATWMQCCDVFVLPSHTEGMPNVVMEAMACGVPVIATEVGGLPDAVGGSGGAVLIRPRCVEELQKAMDAAIESPQKRLEMSVSAREVAEKRFGVTRNANRILKYLQEVIASRKVRE